MAFRDVHQSQTKGAVDGQCRTTHAEAQAVSGQSPGAAARGVRGVGAEREGGSDPELDSAGVDARADAARRGGRGTGGPTLRTRGWGGRDALRVQSGNGAIGRAEDGDPGAASAERTERGTVAQVSGAAREGRN